MSKDKVICVRFENDTYEQLVTLAAAKAKKPAELARELITTGMDAGVLDTQKDLMTRMVMSAVQQAIKPFENRVATMAAKSTISATAAVFMLMQYLRDEMNVDGDTVLDYYDKAREQGYKYLRFGKLESAYTDGQGEQG